MAYDYGYGELENQLIELFRSGAPDFEAAEELLRQGADLNAAGNEDDENILSEILMGYWHSRHGDNMWSSACDHCDEDHCENCKHNDDLNPKLGPSMCKIIRFFLAHGFDVGKLNGCYGAQCLYALVLSTFDRYTIEATKILLDAGARNRTVSPKSTDGDNTPWDFIDTERSFQEACDHGYETSNLYEALCQIYQAVEDKKSYGGIDSYEIAIGKKVLKVLAERDGLQSPFCCMSLPQFHQDNCFTQNLYFVYEGGVLITTQSGAFWTDTRLPDTHLLDVSGYFNGVIGSTIQKFTYDRQIIEEGGTCYGQPVTVIEMSSGKKVKCSINFGEAKGGMVLGHTTDAEPSQKVGYT